jgi:hypothetical protein
MKLKILVLALWFWGFSTALPAAAADCDTGAQIIAVRLGGPEVPFPLSLEIPFPWNAIQGVWSARGDGIDAVFSFEVRNDSPDGKILKVTELDPKTGEVLAEGTGISIPDRKIVRAGMQGPKGIYMLFLRVYQNPNAASGSASATATVLTLSSFANDKEQPIQVVISKISDKPKSKKPSVKKNWNILN